MRTTLLTLTMLFAASCEDRKAPDTTPVRPTTVTPAPIAPAPTVAIDAGAADPMMDAGGDTMMDAGSRGGL
ncbi:MAG TPA: hypothetical protein VGE37_04090 [Archangium sp.]